MNKQTSDRVSAIGARLVHITADVITSLVNAAEGRGTVHPNSPTLENLVSDIHALAGSAMSQDETPGARVPAHEPTFIERLQMERDQLDERLGKLVDYLNKGAPGATPRHKAMLDEQNRLMSELLAVLDERLCDLQISARSASDESTDTRSLRDEGDEA